jgi:hypothetical protein
MRKGNDSSSRRPRPTPSKPDDAEASKGGFLPVDDAEAGDRVEAVIAGQERKVVLDAEGGDPDVGGGSCRSAGK